MPEMLAPWGVERVLSPRKPSRRGRLILTAVIITAVTGGIVAQLLLPQPEVRVPPAYSATTRFYVDPDTTAADWVRHHPGDPRAARIEARIASQPQAVWITQLDPDSLTEQVRQYATDAAAWNTVPTMVAYAIPNRDCGGASSGGVGDYSVYRNWIDHFAQGLVGTTAMVILEPDSLANIGCLPPREQNERFVTLAYAAAALHRADPHIRVYYDGGNSQWEPANVMADRLRRAGINENGNGIALNVSNFNPTGDEVRYGDAILHQLHNSQLAMVVDTSRNGNGAARGHQFCDPLGRKLGRNPTASTGVNRVDAYLWIKHPGQADGCRASPGVFLPDQAYALLPR